VDKWITLLIDWGAVRLSQDLSTSAVDNLLITKAVINMHNIAQSYPLQNR